MINCSVPILVVSIPNFIDYNPRGDVRRPSWYRLQNEFLEDPDFDQAPPTAIIVWLYLIGQVNKQQAERAQVLTRIARAICRQDEVEFSACVNFLINVGKIQVHNAEPIQVCTSTSRPRHADVTPTSRGRDEDVRNPAVTERNGTGRDETERDGTERDGTDDPPERTDETTVDPKPGPKREELVEAWNAECRGGMAKCVAIKPGTKRAKAANARLLEEPDVDAWRKLIKHAATNPFVRGEVPGRDGRPPFRADIDWLLRPNTRIEILEGKWDPKGTSPPPKPANVPRLFTEEDLAKL